MWYDHLSRITHVLLSGPDRILPRARLWARPLRMQIAINDYCNLRCPHCLREVPSIKVDQNRLGVEDLRPLAPWFDSAMFVALAGLGEPFIQKDIYEVIELVQSHGATVSLISNGTLLDEEACQRLIGDGPMLLNLSIDAGTPQVFEKVRLGAKFEEVIANVDRLAALKSEAGAPFPVMSINMTLMRDTLGEVRAVVDLAKRWGIHHVVAQTVLFAEEQTDRSQAVTNREAQRALAEAEDYARAAGVEIRYVPLGGDYATLAQDESEGGEFAASYPYHSEPKTVENAQRFYCSNLWHQMFIDVHGNMTYCCMVDFGVVGNIRDADPAELWNHPSMVALRRRLLSGDPPEECRKCYALEQLGRRKMTRTWKAEFDPLRKMF